MNEGIKKVLETLSRDEAFAKKMSECKSPEEGYELARTVADGFTMEELRDVMVKIYNSYHESGEKELTDDDLVEISGGMDDATAISLGVSGGVMLVLGAGAAFSI